MSVAASAMKKYSALTSSGVRLSARYLSRLLRFCASSPLHALPLHPPTTLTPPGMARQLFDTLRKLRGYNVAEDFFELMTTLSNFNLHQQ